MAEPFDTAGPIGTAAGATGTLPELATRFLHALGGADTEAVLALVTEDLELRIPTAPKGVPRLVSGRAELAHMVSNIERTWTDLSVEVIRADAVAGDPDRGVAQAEVQATNRDGSTYRNTYVVLVETEGGLIRRWTEYYDPGPMVAAIDALRAHARAGR